MRYKNIKTKPNENNNKKTEVKILIKAQSTKKKKERYAGTKLSCISRLLWILLRGGGLGGRLTGLRIFTVWATREAPKIL